MTMNVSVAIFTASYCLSGGIETRGQRVMEVLNSAHSDFLKLYDVHVARSGGQQLPTLFPCLVLKKSAIILCALPGDRHEAPDKRPYALVKKATRLGLVIAGPFEIVGRLSFQGSVDPAAALSHEFSQFFPVSEAACHGPWAESQVTSRVVIVNKEFVCALSISDSAQPEQTKCVPLQTAFGADLIA